ncbi:MAG: diaminopimelate epimerase [Planctomycetaceae bacterium]
MRLVHMHGTGNAFLVLDAFREAMPRRDELPELARSVCDRTTGFGTDGLLVVEPAEDFAGRMTVYNADGSIAEMCGNGLRCIGKLLFDRFYAGSEFVVQTDAGPRKVTVLSSHGEGSDVRISLGRPIFEPERIPTTLPGHPPIEVPLSLQPGRHADSSHAISVTCVSMGNPHAVIFVPNSDVANVFSIGPIVERHSAFPNRTNVEFVTVVSPSELRLRVWEDRRMRDRCRSSDGCCGVDRSYRPAGHRPPSRRRPSDRLAGRRRRGHSDGRRGDRRLR